jgi:hypothetical protein
LRLVSFIFHSILKLNFPFSNEYGGGELGVSADCFLPVVVVVGVVICHHHHLNRHFHHPAWQI